MLQELISTSAPRCLNGNAGFGIVAQTAGMAPNVSLAVSALSGYTHTAAPGSAENPVVYLHAIRQTGGMLRHIVSRIADCGNDYSGRTNRIAHHWIIEEEDIRKLPGGPGALIVQNIFRQNWNEKPAEIPPKTLSALDDSRKKCVTWEQVTGDAGWGGQVAENAEKGNPISIIFTSQHQSDVLRELIREALSLPPTHKRWSITFSTYFLKSQETNRDTIQIKCFLAGSDESRFARQSPNTLVIDLQKSVDPAPQGKYVELARGVVKLPQTAPSETTYHTPMPAAVFAAPIAVPVQPGPYELAGDVSEAGGRHIQTNYGRDGKISTREQPSTNLRNILFIVVAFFLCLSVIGFSVYRFTTDKTETAKNEEQTQKADPADNKPETDKTKQNKNEAAKKDTTPSVKSTNDNADPSPVQEEEAKKTAPAADEPEQNDADPLDNLIEELPKRWESLAWSSKPIVNGILPKSEKLWKYQNRIKLEYVPFVKLNELVDQQGRTIEYNPENLTFKYSDTKEGSDPISGEEKTKTGQAIATIVFNKQGVQFQWDKALKPEDLDAQQFLNRILLGKLQICRSDKPITEIDLWEPYDVTLIKKQDNPGGRFDQDSKVVQELTYTQDIGLKELITMPTWRNGEEELKLLESQEKSKNSQEEPKAPQVKAKDSIVSLKHSDAPGGQLVLFAPDVFQHKLPTEPDKDIPDDIKTKLKGADVPSVWSGLALPVKIPEKTMLNMLSFLNKTEYKDKVELKYVPFVDLALNKIEPFSSNLSHSIAFKFKENGKEIANVSLTDTGMQFKWADDPSFNTRRPFLNRILLSKLRILYDNKVLTDIVLWEPTSTNDGPQVRLEPKLTLIHEFTPVFGSLARGTTQQDVLFAVPKDSNKQGIDEKFYLLHPDGSGKKLLLMKYPPKKNNTKE